MKNHPNTLSFLKPYIDAFSNLVFLAAGVASLVGCGGGGGGGSSTSPYVAVATVSPANKATNIDARIQNVSATFSSSLDVSSFITQGKALGKLLSDKKIQLKNVETQAVVDPYGLTLPELVSGRYTALVQVDGVDTMAIIESYSYVKEESGAFGLSIKLLNVAAPIYFTSAEVLNSGVINSDLFQVKNTTTGALAYGELMVNGNTINFYPVNFLDWGAKYSVTISKSVKDITGRPLEDNFVWEFNTTTLPKPAIESVSPIGIDANPIKKIYAKTNFKTNPDSLSSGSILVHRLDRISSDQAPTKVPVNVILGYDPATAQIVITPAELEYLKEYEVIIKGGSLGPSGSFGNVGGVRLETDYVWTFTTAEPKVVGYSPSATTEVARESEIQIEVNFKPNPSTVASGISITDSTNTLVAFTSSVVDGLIKLQPTSLLKYGMTYTVKVTPDLKAINNSGLSIASEKTFNFTTVKRKVVSQLPLPYSTGASTSARIVVGFNFDVDPNTVKSATNFKVEQQVNSGPFTEVPGIRTYDSVERTVEFDPSTEFVFNAVIRVTVSDSITSTDGVRISQGESWTFTIRNEALTISGTYPINGSVNVPLNSTIETRMSYPIDPDSFSSYSAVTVQDCNYRTVSGRATLDGNSIFFLPSQALSSFCKHTITVDSSIRGTENQKQTQTNSWSFTTDGLSVESVYVTYAYGDHVDVSSPIEINFNYPLSYVYSSDIYLEDYQGYRVSGSLYSYGNRVQFSPYSNLKYGQEYKLVITDQVTGSHGERMNNRYVTSYFFTENIPLNVVDYGPTGTVRVNDYFWVDMNYDTNTSGFPSYSGSLSPYQGVSMSRDSYSTILMTPYNQLQYDQYYYVEFSFKFDRGFYDDFSFRWNVTTEDLTSGTSQKTMASSVSSTASTSSAESRRQGCRSNLNCVGSLKTKNQAEYKKKLAAKKAVNILNAEAKQRYQALKQLRSKGH